MIGMRNGTRMRHELFASVDELLSPAALSVVTGRSVTAVRRFPFHSSDSLSGSRFQAIETDAGERYVLKRIAHTWDWIMRTTDDHHGRAMLAWQTGLLDQLPPEIVHGVVAGARDGEGWAILMRDFGADLIPPGDEPIALADNDCFLEAMAAMQAAFWERSGLADPALGFCSLRGHYVELAPAAVASEVGGDNPIPPLILRGWALLEELVAPAVAETVRALLDEPGPLCAALARYPQTVVHGDWKLGNLGLLRDGTRRVVLLDWAVVGPAPPAVDLAWYLAVNAARLPVSKEETIAHFRAALAARLGDRFDESWWRPQLELGLLGGFVQLGWPKLLGAVEGPTAAVRRREQAELAWWSEQVQAGARWL